MKTAFVHTCLTSKFTKQEISYKSQCYLLKIFLTKYFQETKQTWVVRPESLKKKIHKTYKTTSGKMTQKDTQLSMQELGRENEASL